VRASTTSQRRSLSVLIAFYCFDCLGLSLLNGEHT
jgi:hypothetical protein